MSHAFQNSSHNFNYNSPAFVSPLFIVGLTTAFLSAIIAAAIANPLREKSQSTRSQNPDLTLKSIFGEDEKRGPQTDSENQDSSMTVDSRVEIVL